VARFVLQRFSLTMLHILVADDDIEMRRLLATSLGKAGFQVDLAADGAELLDRVESGDALPDLVVSDVQMPGCTGLRALERIRGLHPTLPVILITAFCDADTEARARKLGAIAVFDKPFSLSALRATIRDHLCSAGAA
jgi:CheY-like chemotaxis protein